MSERPSSAPIPGFGPIPDGHEGVFTPTFEEAIKQVRRASEQSTQLAIEQIRKALRPQAGAEEKTTREVREK